MRAGIKVSAIFRKACPIAVLLALTGVASYFVSGALATAQPPVPGITPYTFKSATYLYGNRKAGRLTAVTTTARRADGTTVQVTSRDAEIAKKIRIRTIRYVDGSHVKLLDAAKVKTTFPPASRSETVDARKVVFQPPTDCVAGGESLIKRHAGKVLGQVVNEIRGPTAMDLKITAWAAPALGCQVMAYRVERKNIDGTYQLVSLKKPLGLKIGEPSPKLFTPGRHYTEMSPSQFGRRLAALVGKSLPPGKSPSMARLDNEYSRIWARNPGWHRN
jgi:hypothetical protein